MKKLQTTKPPDHLSPEARDWWTRLQREYAVDDDAGRLLLQTAMEAHDRMRNCAACILRDGEMVQDRFGQSKPHPLLAAERDARSQMLLAIKALNFDIKPSQPIGRPGTKGYMHGN